ncbi:MAG: LemA family protein [Patescibacteria group bacterium]
MQNYIIWIILGAVGLLALWLMVLYNGLIASRNHVDEAWSDIEVQLKRRYNLIPNLVEAVKGYVRHESSVFEKVTAARSAAMGAKTMDEHAQAENALTGTLKTLFAVAESYPDLKASQNFLDLQNELTDAEDKIQAARRFFNGNTRDYNIKLQSFPANLIAGTLGFSSRQFFEIQNNEERETPKVSF